MICQNLWHNAKVLCWAWVYLVALGAAYLPLDPEQQPPPSPSPPPPPQPPSPELPAEEEQHWPAEPEPSAGAGEGAGAEVGRPAPPAFFPWDSLSDRSVALKAEASSVCQGREGKMKWKGLVWAGEKAWDIICSHARGIVPRSEVVYIVGSNLWPSQSPVLLNMWSIEFWHLPTVVSRAQRHRRHLLAGSASFVWAEWAVWSFSLVLDTNNRMTQTLWSPVHAVATAERPPHKWLPLNKIVLNPTELNVIIAQRSSI